MWSLFHSGSQFNSQKSLRDNFIAMCSLPFHKTRSHATQELIQNLSDKKLNYSLSLMEKKPVFKTPEPDSIDFEAYEENIRIERDFENKKLKSFQKKANVLLQQEGATYQSVKSNVLHDIAMLEIAQKSISKWSADREKVSERTPLVIQFRNKISNLREQYDAIYESIHQQHMQALLAKRKELKVEAKIEHEELLAKKDKTRGAIPQKFFFGEATADPFVLRQQYLQKPTTKLQMLEEEIRKNQQAYNDYFTSHDRSARPALLASILNAEEKSKYGHILTGAPAPQPKQHWWNRLGFAVFTPFLNLLIDTDSFNFFVDGFNVFSDLVRVF